MFGVTADVMKSQGANMIFALDVGSQDESSLTNYGDELSGWWLMWKRWNPWTETPRVGFFFFLIFIIL